MKQHIQQTNGPLSIALISPWMEGGNHQLPDVKQTHPPNLLWWGDLHQPWRGMFTRNSNNYYIEILDNTITPSLTSFANSVVAVHVAN